MLFCFCFCFFLLVFDLQSIRVDNSNNYIINKNHIINNNKIHLCVFHFCTAYVCVCVCFSMDASLCVCLSFTDRAVSYV